MSDRGAAPARWRSTGTPARWRAATALGLVLVVLGGCGEEGGRRATPKPTVPHATTTTAVTTTTTTTTAPPPLPPAALAVVVSRGSPERDVVALTFDAGSDTGHTAAILDSLATRGIPATFGVTGTWVRANPELARRIVAAGHLLVNHTDDHRSFTGHSTNTAPLSNSERAAELDAAEATVVATIGVSTKPWFRPPYGDTDESVQRDVAALGYRYELMWTVDSLGWNGLAPDAITERCLSRAVPGAIYLFHVGSASADAVALPAIIDGLRARGYGFVTVAEFVGA